MDDPEPERLRASVRRGLAWLLSMQNGDGGWGAFDHENDQQFLNHIPFADHNAMIDPSTADVTARVIECLGRFGWPAAHPAIQRGVKFLLRDQCEEGAWFGRWGVNYVYGTSGVLRALETVGLGALPEYRQRAAVAAFGAESGRRLRRIHAVVLRSDAEGPGQEHRVADGMGLIGLAGGGSAACGR